MAISKEKKKIGLALGGGGAKGLAHIGVIKTLERGGLPIDFIAGTSMGALVGGWYALTKDIEKLEEIFFKLNLKDLFPVKDIVRGKKFLRSKTADNLLARYFGNKKIEDCLIPFSAIATDVGNGDEIIINKGGLKKAVEASIALPIVFDPILSENRLLMDGGFSNPVPADVVRRMGADYVIAVDVSSKWLPYQEEVLKKEDIPAIIADSLAVIEYQIAKDVLKDADLILRPPVLNYEWTAFNKAEEIAAIGAEEARIRLKTIRRKAGYPEPAKTLGEKFLDFLFEN